MVYLAQHKFSGAKFAIKVMLKEKMDRNRDGGLTEIAILRECTRDRA